MADLSKVLGDGRDEAVGAAVTHRPDSGGAKQYEVTPIDAKPAAYPSTTIRPRMPKRLTAKLLLHLVHRFCIFLCAIGYVCISFGASYTAMQLLRGHSNPWSAPSDYTMPFIASSLGSGALRDSPLVKTTLHDSTAPSNATIFLHANATAQFTPCDDLPPAVAKVFSNTFMRTLFEAITIGASYNITEVAPSAIELIAPIVDCASAASQAAEVASAKFFFLVRDRADHESVRVLIAYVSNQQYKSSDQSGAAAVATIQLMRDMRETNLDTKAHYIVSLGYPYQRFNFRKYEFLNITDDGLVTLQLVPPPGKRELRNTIETACREGFYIKGESEQSNVNNYHWVLEADAIFAVSRWRWTSKPVLHDSWAWVHGLQFFIGLSLLSNLTILCLATYRNFRTGHRWIGDAFVSISTSQVITALAVAVSWYLNEYWSVREFAYSTASQLEGDSSVMAYDWHMRADFFTLYLGVCGIIGHAFRERIDPIFATLCFLMGYDGRVAILKNVFPSIASEVMAYANYIYAFNIRPRVPGQDKISPMAFWTSHTLIKPNIPFLLRANLPIYATLVWVVLFVIVRRVYRFLYPPKVHVQRDTHGTATSENEQSLLAQARVLTLFEVATGAKLAHRFGVLTDFETCVFIRGIKYASSDGIYSTGFVIANKKFLLQTSDYWSIVIMKILRRRYKNVYVYDVSGHTVQQTARLVYPHTFSVADLMNIDVSTLS